MVWQPQVEQRPHPFGEAGVNNSLEEVCRRAAEGASEILGNAEHLARVRTWAGKKLKQAQARGESVTSPGDRARVLLHAVQHDKLWVPDPIGIEYIPKAHLMACDGETQEDGTPCVQIEDCDGKTVLLAACFMAVGLYTMIVGHAYDPAGKIISHVLTKVYFGGTWHYADPSPVARGKYQSLGKCAKYTRERYYSMPNIRVVCDAASCDARSFDPNELGFVQRGTFVGLNGIAVEELPPEVAVRWLEGPRLRWLGDVPEECKVVPRTLDLDTFKQYGERCGSAAALDWLASEYGVDVSGCRGKGSAGATAECVANNYGATLDIIGKDGSIHWNNLAKDAGAIGGVLVCAAMGLGAAAPICGVVGAEIVQVLGTLASDVGQAILNLFWGGDDGGGWACGKVPFDGVRLSQMSQDIAAFMRTAQTSGSYTTDMLIGNPVKGNLVWSPGPAGPGVTPTYTLSGVRYWSRVLALRGVATSTAILASDFMRKTGLSAGEAISVLKPDAPRGWTEFVRPELHATTSSKLTPDYLGSVGGLLTVVTEPGLVSAFDGSPPKDVPVAPRWQLPQFWSSVSHDVGGQIVWRYFMCAAGCPNDAVVWGDVDQVKAKKMLSILPGKPGHDKRQSYVVFGTPKSIDDAVLQLTDDKFAALIDAWKKSLSADMKQKLVRGRALATARGKKYAGLKITVGLAAAAGLAWWYFT